ncbi:MAG TPA: SIR2 family protein [Methanothrix sp.]|nr:SIR2 family protein [Methanothrix sp.]HPJ83280.1 SIR2 family protein [Methanothrix sp.]
MSDEIRALAEDMVSRQRSGVDPYIFFLGAGASISSGCSSMMQIVDAVLESHANELFDKWQSQISEAAKVDLKFAELLKESIAPDKIEKFYEVWKRLDKDTRYSILREHLWENKSPSDGYRDFCQLIEKGYIKIVLSTNLDHLLEAALNKYLSWYAPDRYMLVVNGKDKNEEICDQLESPLDLFRLIKLHGSLNSRNSYAFTPDEIFDFEKSIKPSLSRIINQSMVVIGHSMQDRDINVLFQDEGKEIHYINPSSPKTGTEIYTILSVRGLGSVIEGEDAKFDRFFNLLKKYIEEKTQDIEESNSSKSIEGFLKTIGFDHELRLPRSRFKNLPSLYVKPTEYDDICSKLEKDHIIFIIGEPHIGKTFTALYILWEYYEKGYEPLHIRYDKLVGLLQKYDNNMERLLPDLFSSETGTSRIIHFDDPFGETLDRRSDEFAKHLDTFLNLARQYEHLRIIITTRHSIFKEAVAEFHNLEKVAELEKDLRVHTSYKPDVLLNILNRYVQFYKPLWASNKEIIEGLEDQLPDLLPAPHNIEFFVRTSEKLNSLEEVLRHVEISKEMVKALSEWMVSLPDHEQIFLIWLEVCSTANVLFPNTPASKMDIEKAYRETLAYMFKETHVSGIPTNPFSHAMDKFDMILLENKDETGSIKFDFVHPSYHEAFWHAIRRRSILFRWWELLKENYAEIFNNWDDKVDIVQLRMIERYGSVNRDLDILLLISAKSEDTFEQFIAFEYMLKRMEHFRSSPEFSYCAISLLESDAFDFLKLIHSYLDILPRDILNNVAQLIFKPDAYHIADEFLLENFSRFPDTVKLNPKFLIWNIGARLKGKLDLDTLDTKDFYLACRSIIESGCPFNLDAKIENTNDEAYVLTENILYILSNYDNLNQDEKELFNDAITSENLYLVKKYIEKILSIHDSPYTLDEYIESFGPNETDPLLKIIHFKYASLHNEDLYKAVLDFLEGIKDTKIKI